jgi:hypothetical protein
VSGVRRSDLQKAAARENGKLGGRRRNFETWEEYETRRRRRVLTAGETQRSPGSAGKTQR